MKIYTLPIEMVNALRSWFHPKDRHIYLSDSQYIISQRVAWETVFSKFVNLPGLVGFWPMGSVQRSTGNAYDATGQGRDLTYNGNPTYNVYNNLVPYVDLDGSGDYLSRADETDLDLTGAETIYAANVRGLTIGGWFWLDSLSGGVARGFIGKYNATGNQRGYLLFLNSDDTASFLVSSNGTATTAVNGPVLAINRWYFLVARFIPLTSLDIFVGSPDAESPNDWIKTSNTTSVPASVFANTAAFEISRFNASATTVIDGRASLCSLCANALNDNLLEMSFQQSRMLFKWPS